MSLRYQHFSACVSQVLGLLQSKDPDSAAKVSDVSINHTLSCRDGPRTMRGPGVSSVCAGCLQVLELLLAMCTVSGLRPLLCVVVFRPVGPKLRAAGRRQGAGLDACRKAESGLALVQWLSSPVEGADSCSLQVLQLLNELLEVRQADSCVCVFQPCSRVF